MTLFKRGGLPLLGLFAGLSALYVAEALLHGSPWIFFDELDYSMNARAIAHLGTLPGAKPYSFEGFYPFLISPAWLASSIHTAYTASKAIGAVTMAAAVFPAYGLARTLAVSRPAALFAAAGTGFVPALSYSSSLMTETLAYPYATLSYFLIVKALATRSRGWLIGAVTAAVVAPVVRKELAVIPAAFAVAALAYVAIPWLGRSRRRWAGAVLASAAALAVLAWALTWVSTTWSSAVGDPVKMVAYARSGAGSLVVGVAVLPAVAGLAALVRPRGEPRTAERRAFTCLFAAAAVGFLLYTAAKGVYLGPLANPVEERNLIYLVPLLFAATGVWLMRRRAEILASAAAAALVGWLVATVPLHFSSTPASDAPSLEVLRSLGWGAGAVHGLLVAAVVVSLLVLLGRPPAILVGVLALLILTWTLSSEVYASNLSRDYARVLAASVPRPLDWITRATGEAPSLYVGQEIVQPTDIWLLRFWNTSLVRTRSLDGIPGTGDIRRISVERDGVLATNPRLQFLVADQGITGIGPVLARGERWRVYRLGHPARLQSATLGVYSDGWMGGKSSYTVYAGSRPGVVHVTLSRRGWCGEDVPGQARIAIDGVVRARPVVHACRTVAEHLRTPRPPFTVEVTIDPTFSPAGLDPRSFTDTRHLGAQVRYRFTPGSS